MPEFGDLGEGRDGAGVPLRLEVGGGLAAVVAGRDGDGLHLLVRVQPRLAGLQLDQVEDLGLAGEDEIVEAEQHGRALPYRRLRPQRLRGAGRVEGLRHVLGCGLGQVGELLTGERRVVGGPAGADHTLRELGDQLRGDHIGGGTGACGDRREGVRAGRRFRTGLFRGLRVRHVRQGMPRREVWVPVGNRDSPSTHTAPVITGNECADQGVVRG